MADSAFTEDAVLGGALKLRQPRHGHRVGHDAILLAAATPAHGGEHAVELGSGVGAAGLALARRVDGLKVTLAEIDDELAAMAAHNAALNGLADRVRAMRLDVAAEAPAYAAAGLKPGQAARVLMNPPFNDPSRQISSADPGRRLAHAASSETLLTWVRAAHMLLAPAGTLTLIWRADGIAEVLAALGRAFGGITVLPVHPKPGAAAIRILAGATKGSRAPIALLPGLVLNDEKNRPTAQAEALLREGAALALAKL